MKNIALLVLLMSTFAMAQTDSLTTTNYEDALHLREIPKHNLLVELGIAQPTGNYSDISRSGLSIGMEYLYYANKTLGFGIALRHQYNEFGYLDYQNDDNTSVSDNDWVNTSISVGPTYTYTQNRFQFDIYLKGGVAFLNNPDNTITQIGTSNAQIFSSNSENSSSTSAYIESGLRFNYYFRRSVQVFFAPQFNSTLGESIEYSTKNNTVTTVIQPNVTEQVKMSNLIFNVGVKIAIGKTYSNGEMRVDD